MQPKQSNAEQATLKFSIALTVFLGVLGVASGLATGSQAIIFDGMYSSSARTCMRFRDFSHPASLEQLRALLQAN